jgi:hypothetical protein
MTHTYELQNSLLRINTNTLTSTTVKLGACFTFLKSFTVYIMRFNWLCRKNKTKLLTCFSKHCISAVCCFFEYVLSSVDRKKHNKLLNWFSAQHVRHSVDEWKILAAIYSNYILKQKPLLEMPHWLFCIVCIHSRVRMFYSSFHVLSHETQA